MDLNFDIIVVSSKHRKPLITEYLKDIPHKISLTEDYNLPPQFVPIKRFGINIDNQTGAYRCFRGHQEALKLAEKENILIFEDDAVPNRSDWLNIVKTSEKLLFDYQIVSLHGRAIRCIKNKLIIDKVNFVQLGQDPVYKMFYALGSLAYLINKNTAQKIINENYNGWPMDLYILNFFKFCIVNPSPFNHDRKYGSLVERPK